MRKALILSILSVALVAACGPNNTQLEKQAVNNQQDQLLKLYPVPFFDTSLERGIVIQLYAIRNQARNTHAVVTSQGTGTVLWDCPSIGYPIPYDVQLTNPVKDGGGGTVIEQPEPNGLYSSKNSDATWVLCAADDGTVTQLYTEQKVNTFPFPVSVDYTTGRIVRAGAAAVTVDIGKAANP